MFNKLTAALFVFIVTSYPCFATDSGNDFLPKCKAAIYFLEKNEELPLEKQLDATSCLNYLKGFWEGSQSAFAMVSVRDEIFGMTPAVDPKTKQRMDLKRINKGFVWCAPSSDNDIKLPQIVRLVVKFLEDHPEDLHKNISMLTTEALLKAFSCKDGVFGNKISSVKTNE